MLLNIMVTENLDEDAICLIELFLYKKFVEACGWVGAVFKFIM